MNPFRNISAGNAFTEDLSKEDFNSVIDGEEEIMYKPNEWGSWNRNTCIQR